MTNDAVVAPPPPETAVSAREEAMRLARAGMPLTAKEFMAILRITQGSFYVNDKAGKYDAFKMTTVGVRRYSGSIISRWMDGEEIYPPRRRRRG